MTLIDASEHLKRNDKWYVGGGGMLIYAPPFPEHDAVPGYWDVCHFGNLRLQHLLAIAFIEEGRELKPCLEKREWFPNRSIYEYSLAPGLSLTMTRSCEPPTRLTCQLAFRIIGRRSRTVDVVAWTPRSTRDGGRRNLVRGFKREGEGLSFVQVFHARGPKPVFLKVGMSADRKPLSYQVTPAHSSLAVPEFEFTPFADSQRHGKLANELVGENILGGTIYAALQYRLQLGPRDANTLTVHLDVEPAGRNDRGSAESGVSSASVPRRGTGVRDATSAVRSWEDFLALVPHFECSDEFITRYYWYRWYGIWLNSLPGGIVSNYPFPAIAEGIDYFRGIITYSLMSHLREAKWLRTPSLAHGCIRNHIVHKTRSGHFAGHIYASHVNDTVFYHTDWGGALAELVAHHPDSAFEAEIFPALVDCLRYYRHQRDVGGSGLFDVTDQFETGQELSSRYFFADERADLYGWENKLRMKGVDASFYVWRLADYLARASDRLGYEEEAREFRLLAESIAEAMRTRMWDRATAFFFDYDERRKLRSPFWAAVGFYPVGSEIATKEMVFAALEHLFHKAKFGTPFPTPTSPVDDPYFSAEPRWRKERANCPWNGRVWPMVNSHIVEVLGYAAELDAKYRRKLATYLKDYIRMMFFEGDPRRPNCFEHYHPFDGTPSTYRGVDDYQHSWVADLILKYVAGVRAVAHGVTIDPFPFGLDWFLLKDARLRGRRLDVEWNRDLAGDKRIGFRVRLDGEVVVDARKLTHWEHAW